MALLFKYSLKCTVCGLLAAKAITETIAEDISLKHAETYKVVFGEDHIVKIIDVSKK